MLRHHLALLCALGACLAQTDVTSMANFIATAASTASPTTLPTSAASGQDEGNGGQASQNTPTITDGDHASASDTGGRPGTEGVGATATAVPVASSSQAVLKLRIEQGMTADNFLELFKPSDSNSTVSGYQVPEKAHLIGYQPIAGLVQAVQGPVEVQLPALVRATYRAVDDSAAGDVEQGDGVEGDRAMVYFSVQVASGSDLMCVIERSNPRQILSSNRQTKDETFVIREEDWQNEVGVTMANQPKLFKGLGGEVRMRCSMAKTQQKKISG